MKKLLSLTLCIIFVCLALVGCKEDVIGEYLPNYQTGAVTDDQIEKLNFYIITGDSTSEDAKITVPQNINTYLKEKYHIELNINYFTEDAYADAVYSAMNTTDESLRPDIILINSAGMFDQLHSNDELIALNSGAFDFYNGSDFRKLNRIVDSVLLDASSVDGTYYTVPNNHVIGHYEYIVIDKAMARDTLHFSNEELAKMKTESSLEELRNEITALDADIDADEYVKIVTNGTYSDFESLKKINLQTGEVTDTERNIVNVKSYPNATKEQAFLSAFAIVKQLDDTGTYTEDSEAVLRKHYSNCMKIIYALNDDPQLKNMLQYGYVGTNYSFVVDDRNENTDYIKLIKTPSVRYEMNNIYTGNPLISYYCEEISWTENVANLLLRQNADAKTPHEKLKTEAEGLIKDITSVITGSTLELPSFGNIFTDVQISWSSESDNATISEGVVTFVNITEAVEVEATIKATLSCCGETTEKIFKVIVTRAS